MMHTLLKTFPLTIGNLPKSSRPEPDDLTVQRSADIEHARRVQLLRDGLIRNDNDSERGLLWTTSMRNLYPPENNAIVAGKSRGVSEYHAVLVATLPPGAATSHQYISPCEILPSIFLR